VKLSKKYHKPRNYGHLAKNKENELYTFYMVEVKINCHCA